VRPHLDGDVSPELVVLYRKRGVSVWYGSFRGQFQSRGAKSCLVGKFVRTPGVFMSVWAGFVILWGLGLTFVVINRWQGSESIGWLVAAAIALTVGCTVFWFRAKNASVEAEIIEDEIRSILGSPGA
jgi:hypothetical protein